MLIKITLQFLVVNVTINKSTTTTNRVPFSPNNKIWRENGRAYIPSDYHGNFFRLRIDGPITEGEGGGALKLHFTILQLIQAAIYNKGIFCGIKLERVDSILSGWMVDESFKRHCRLSYRIYSVGVITPRRK